MEAEHEAAASPVARFDAVEGHFQRMKELAHDEHARGKSNDSGVAQARAYVVKAELEVAKANASNPAPPLDLFRPPERGSSPCRRQESRTR